MFGLADDDDDDDDERDAQRTCAACARSAPHTETAHTLISKVHGWRLTRSGGVGRPAFQWFCPSCWKARSVATTAA